jgi:2-methylcitrate dehydratase PrpD
VRTQTGFEYRADSVLNAQMSLQYNVAVALHDRQAYLEQFTPQRTVDPAVCETARRVEIEVDPEIDQAYPEVYGGRLTLVLKNGRRLSKRVDYSRGMPENPMSGQEIERKFESLATASVGRTRGLEILAAARELFEASSVKPLAGLLADAQMVEGAAAC